MVLAGSSYQQQLPYSFHRLPFPYFQALPYQDVAVAVADVVVVAAAGQPA